MHPDTHKPFVSGALSHQGHSHVSPVPTHGGPAEIEHASLSGSSSFSNLAGPLFFAGTSHQQELAYLQQLSPQKNEEHYPSETDQETRPKLANFNINFCKEADASMDHFQRTRSQLCIVQ